MILGLDRIGDDALAARASATGKTPTAKSSSEPWEPKIDERTPLRRASARLQCERRRMQRWRYSSFISQTLERRQ